MNRDPERLREERALIPSRLTGFLLWQSILLLAFAEIMAHSGFLSEVLSILGAISAMIGLRNFWGLPALIDSLEGREDQGLRRAIERMFQGRGLGIPCSLIFIAFWACAMYWSFRA